MRGLEGEKGVILTIADKMQALYLRESIKKKPQ